MKDFALEIRFDADDPALEERVFSGLYLTGSSGSRSFDGGLVAYYADAAARDAALEVLRGARVDVRAADPERVDWLEHYQQSLEAIEIGERFIVAPDPSLIEGGSDRLTLVIPQEQAFGTGSHETTSLCIEILEWLDLEGKRGLDVGAGSGILALAMLRLGASKAIAFDNDVDAFGALRDNRIRNGVGPASMPLFIGGYESLIRGEFDVVTMNIIPEVILPALPHIVWRLGKGAKLIVSGVLIVRANEVVHWAEQHRLRLFTEREKGEWWAGGFELPW